MPTVFPAHQIYLKPATSNWKQKSIKSGFSPTRMSIYLYPKNKPKNRENKMCAKRWHVNKLGGKDRTKIALNVLSIWCLLQIFIWFYVCNIWIYVLAINCRRV